MASWDESILLPRDGHPAHLLHLHYSSETYLLPRVLEIEVLGAAVGEHPQRLQPLISRFEAAVLGHAWDKMELPIANTCSCQQQPLFFAPHFKLVGGDGVVAPTAPPSYTTGLECTCGNTWLGMFSLGTRCRHTLCCFPFISCCLGQAACDGELCH